MYTTHPATAAARAAVKAEKARASIARNTIAGGVSGGAMYPHLPEGYQVVTLAPSTRGRNARGTSAAKRGWGGSQPKSAKRAKRQDGARMGNEPRLRLSPWDTLHAKREPTVADYLGITL